MRRERNLWCVVLVIGLAAVVAGCGKPAEGNAAPSGPTANSTPALPTSETLRAEACACTTKACADQVTEAIAMERQRVEEHFDDAESCLANSGLAGPADKVLRIMSGFRDKTCACKDQVCVEFVEKEMMEWAMKNMDELKDLKPSKVEEEQADKLTADMKACKARFSTEP